MSSQKKAIVLFFSPGCIHCKNIMPLVQTSEQNTGVPVLYANINDERGAAKFFEIDSVPELVVIDRGQITNKFSGERTVEKISKFLKDNSK